MGHKRYANALVVESGVEFDRWMEEIRQQHDGAVSKDYVGRIAKTVLRKADPKQYLLSHSTIVASVDTYTPKNVKTGRLMNRGVQIDVRFPDFRVKPECDELINNNSDCWSRSLLLSTYKTFVGADNFCFLPGTLVLMADGTQRSIEDISIGDEVISHTGVNRRVVHKHVRDYEGEIKHIYTGHRTKPISCTPNHPFFRLDKSECVSCGKKLDCSKRPTSYKKRILRSFCSSCKGGRVRLFPSQPYKVQAESLEKRAILFAPIPKRKSVQSDGTRFAKIMGYYLAEGCIGFSGNQPTSVIFTVGTHEKELIQSILDSVRSVYPNSLPKVSLSSCSDECTRIVCYNTELAVALYDTCGHLAHEKRLSTEWINSASSEDIFALIGAYVSGDADIHCVTQRLRICSVSLQLLQQIQYIASSVQLHSFIVDHSREVGSSTLIKFKDGTYHEVVSRHQPYLLHFDVQSSKSLSPYTTAAKHQTRSITSGDLKFFDGMRTTFVNRIESDLYCGKVFNLEVEEDHSYVAEGVAVANCEHIQLKELSKGFIVDAIARDLGKTCYIDILVATDRKHTKLIQDILSGSISALSMGCVSLFTICNKCGNVAADDSTLCPCIMYEGKGQKFTDEDGIEHVLGELIGHVSVPNSNQFIEASWVHNPAFRGAVRRNILNPDMVTLAAKIPEAQAIYEIRRDQMNFDGIKKAASVKVAQDEDQAPTQQSDPEEEQQSEPTDEEPTETKDSGVADSDDKSLDKMLEAIQSKIMESLVRKLDEKLQPRPEDVGTVAPTVDSGNDNLVTSFTKKVRANFPNNEKLVRWASHAYKIVRGGVQSIRASNLKPNDLIVLSWIEDRVNSKKYAVDLYKTVMAVGPSSTYPSERSFLAACKLQHGKNLSNFDEQFLLHKGRIASSAVPILKH